MVAVAPANVNINLPRCVCKRAQSKCVAICTLQPHTNEIREPRTTTVYLANHTITHTHTRCRTIRDRTHNTARQSSITGMAAMCVWINYKLSHFVRSMQKVLQNNQTHSESLTREYLQGARSANRCWFIANIMEGCFQFYTYANTNCSSTLRILREMKISSHMRVAWMVIVRNHCTLLLLSMTTCLLYA